MDDIEEFFGILEEWPERDRTWDIDNGMRLRLGAQEIKGSFPPDHKFKFAEVGIFSGSNAVALLEAFPTEEAWFIDPWLGSPIGNSQSKWNYLHDLAAKRIYKYPNTRILRTTSNAAAGIVPNDLDFIYIDAIHEYEPTRADINLWYRKLHPNGWLHGDDLPYPGVKKAVSEFVNTHKLTCHVAGSQWWFRKIN